MKKIIIVLILVVVSVTFFSCDKIDGVRTEENNSGVSIGDNAVVLGDDTLVVADDPNPSVQRVMIEEFTGHLCGACPPAAVILNDSLKGLFGDRLVVVTIHSGHFADVCPGGLDCIGTPAGTFTDDYTCTVGDAIHDEFGFLSYPMAMVSRVDYPTAHKKTSPSWKSAAQNVLNEAPKVKLTSEVLYDTTSREVKAAVRVEMVQNFTGNLKLEMVIVEDSIVGYQQWYNHTPQFVPDYVFHDILRLTMNGDFGQPINSDGTLISGEKFIQGYSATLLPNWNEHHCKLIAYVFDESNYRVLQVIEKEITD